MRTCTVLDHDIKVKNLNLLEETITYTFVYVCSQEKEEVITLESGQWYEVDLTPILQVDYYGFDLKTMQNQTLQKVRFHAHTQ